MKAAVLLGAMGWLVCFGCNDHSTAKSTTAPESTIAENPQVDPAERKDPAEKTPGQPVEPKDDPCRPFHDEGLRLYKEQKLDEAAAAFAKGYEQCGPGYGFLGKEGFVRSEQGKIEEAAGLYLKEVSEPGPQPQAFGNLEQVRDKLSAETRARIVGMGASASNPVYVIGVGGEYSWARAFTCMGTGQLLESKQSIASGPKGQMLDKLAFKCQDGTEHTVFFDYGVDPAEEAYKREREAIDKAAKGAP